MNIFLIFVVRTKYIGNPPMAIFEQIKSPTEQQCLFSTYCSCFSLLHHVNGHSHEACNYYHESYISTLNQDLCIINLHLHYVHM
jgi:hypothetical protein